MPRHTIGRSAILCKAMMGYSDRSGDAALRDGHAVGMHTSKSVCLLHLAMAGAGVFHRNVAAATE